MWIFAAELWTHSPHQYQNRKLNNSVQRNLNKDFFELLFNHFTWHAFTLLLSSLFHPIEGSPARGIQAGMLENKNKQKGCIPPHTEISKAKNVWIAQAHWPCQACVATNSDSWSLLVAYLGSWRAKPPLAQLWKQIGEGLPDSSPHFGTKW